VVTVKAGSRFRSVTCTTEVIVVKGSGEEIDLRCGGAPMVAIDDTGATASAPVAPFDAGTAVGKRYVAGDTLEVLCTKAGAGSLSVGDAVLDLKGAKPLPSSD